MTHDTMSPSTASPDRELPLVEHLAELRARLVRSLLYIGICTVAAWIFYPQLFSFVSAPVTPYLKATNTAFLVTGPAEGFNLKMQISFLAGLIVSVPLLTSELWRFLVPALTQKERHAVMLVAPLSIVLFASGVALAYYILPIGFKWLLAQNPPNSTYMPNVSQTLLFILKMCLGFGVVFQLPVILMFLGKIGIVSSTMLKSYWRYAVVLMAIVAAVITPSNDAITMLFMCAPMIGLYLASIVLVRMVEKT